MWASAEAASARLGQEERKAATEERKAPRGAPSPIPLHPHTAATVLVLHPLPSTSLLGFLLFLAANLLLDVVCSLTSVFVGSDEAGTWASATAVLRGGLDMAVPHPIPSHLGLEP